MVEAVRAALIVVEAGAFKPPAKDSFALGL
jgi:hypothetical protein